MTRVEETRAIVFATLLKLELEKSESTLSKYFDLDQHYFLFSDPEPLFLPVHTNIFYLSSFPKREKRCNLPINDIRFCKENIFSFMKIYLYIYRPKILNLLFLACLIKIRKYRFVFSLLCVALNWFQLNHLVPCHF